MIHGAAKATNRVFPAGTLVKAQKKVFQSELFIKGDNHIPVLFPQNCVFFRIFPSGFR